MAGIADVLDVERILEAHEAQADRAVAQVGSFALRRWIEVDVDHVVEHADRSADRGCELFLIEPFFRHVLTRLIEPGCRQQSLLPKC